MNTTEINYSALSKYEKEADTVPYFNIVAQTTENTVVTEYEPVKTRSGNYQSEAALEKEFIRMLTEQGYEYLTIHHEKDLIANLRTQLEKINGYHFSETEWYRFFKDSIANQNEGMVAQRISLLLTRRIFIITSYRSSTSMLLALLKVQSMTTDMM